jgi:uncharacterized protein YidB (DUF937 family)
MGLLDVLNGMKNGPGGQQPAGSTGGMSPLTMAVLGYLAYKGLKHFSSSSSANTGDASETSSPGGGGMLSGGLGGLLSGGLGGLLASGNGGAALSTGLGALLRQFQQSGNAGQANSWVGTGANKDISEQELAKSIGADDIKMLSEQTGMNRNDLLSALRRELPDVVDQLTPQGRVPEPHELSGRA